MSQAREYEEVEAGIMGDRVVLTQIIKRLAEERGGCITVYEVARELGISNKEAQWRLRYLKKKGDMYTPIRGLYCLSNENSGRTRRHLAGSNQ